MTKVNAGARRSLIRGGWHGEAIRYNRQNNYFKGMIVIATGIRYALICAALACQAALASPHYVFGPFLAGDESVVTDLNDHGTALIVRGNMNGTTASYYWPDASSPASGGAVLGYLGGEFDGVQAYEINNNNDILGLAMKDGAWVPTLWIGGTPFDLSDPANAGLVFERDPGPKFATINPYDLEIIGQPFPNYEEYNSGPCDYLTNARGDLIARVYMGVYTCGGGMLTSDVFLRQVPEPSSLALIFAGFAGAAWARRTRAT